MNINKVVKSKKTKQTSVKTQTRVQEMEKTTIPETRRDGQVPV